VGNTEERVRNILNNTHHYTARTVVSAIRKISKTTKSQKEVRDLILQLNEAYATLSTRVDQNQTNIEVNKADTQANSDNIAEMKSCIRHQEREAAKEKKRLDIMSLEVANMPTADMYARLELRVAKIEDEQKKLKEFQDRRLSNIVDEQKNQT
jgi:hypothetical protein